MVVFLRTELEIERRKVNSRMGYGLLTGHLVEWRKERQVPMDVGVQFSSQCQNEDANRFKNERQILP